ncbi:MAG: Iron-sulfur cluster assembly scaffold protein NifU [Candidatus Ozemobacter sibiricus]|jgi:NifU-like protein|uniref:Nitrogen fixation protein NifU n=1 Tax=Candidatus Ozemobacter sibiricus TaxID=2268124 RepID=A0A367ZRD5_9BACT|nr:MAG: Iron-sulfur cluster assembly scaffold protein NifU [Candidatus Ozemobacter sibiricus]
MWDYTNSVLDHFTNPRNVGEIEDANAIGEVGSLACGDALKLFLKIDQQTGRILDAKFKTFGCASAIASASALTEMVKGKTIDEALKISNDDIARFLGGLPEQKMHCSVMGKEALEAAVANYRGEKVAAHEEEPPVCKCFWVSEKKIREVILEHKLTTVEQVTNYTKAGGGCGGCLPDIKRILADIMHTQAPPAERPKMTNLQRIQLISQTIEKDVAPMLRADGGNIELVDIDGTLVKVRLKGACAGCAGAKATLQHLVQETLRQKVSPDLVVVEEN